ncbi:hypothetical protein BDE02_01G159800 [Populus trichocarpa]|nr:hypothetical protein BDE02_01G159800 [Populus trichocarpa]
MGQTLLLYIIKNHSATVTLNINGQCAGADKVPSLCSQHNYQPKNIELIHHPPIIPMHAQTPVVKPCANLPHLTSIF